MAWGGRVPAGHGRSGGRRGTRGRTGELLEGDRAGLRVAALAPELHGVHDAVDEPGRALLPARRAARAFDVARPRRLVHRALDAHEVRQGELVPVGVEDVRERLDAHAVPARLADAAGLEVAVAG